MSGVFLGLCMFVLFFFVVGCRGFDCLDFGVVDW